VGGRVTVDASGGASDVEARQLAAAFRSLLEWVHAPEGGARNEVAALVQGVLGEAGTAESVVTRQLPPFEQVNLQTALNAWSAEEGRQVEVRGVALPPHYGGIMLQQLVSGEGLPPLRLSAPGVVDLPDVPGSTLACLRASSRLCPRGCVVAALLIGYARVSTDAQDLTAQREGLAALGVAPARIYVDHGLTGTTRGGPACGRRWPPAVRATPWW
jgi:hypothetical protein